MKHPTPNTQHPAFERVIALKVDVDTFWGMRKGVPRLLDLFKKHRVSASLFVPMGRDHTGWTVKRVFTRRGFLSKASRSGALKTYGLKTLLYGLLLPGPEIAKNHATLLKEVIKQGHELGIHGLDHVFWHDHIKNLDREKTEKILREAVETYRGILGVEPLSFAAPGWMINQHALRFFQRAGFRYSSDVRGKTPFLPVMAGSSFELVQVPTTLPTLDEVVGLEGNDSSSLSDFFLGALTDGLNVLTVHAELEGKHWTDCLDMFITKALSAGFSFHSLMNVCDTLKEGNEMPRHQIVFGQVRGRAGEVTLQGSEL
jgi:peptidoglycan/xylan/chitin deacetylase (PgdA/CDA1 family)